MKTQANLILSLSILLLVISGCAQTIPQPIQLDAALDHLTGKLISSIKSDSAFKSRKKDMLVVYNPFYSVGSNSVLQNMSDRIAASLTAKAKNTLPNFRLEILTGSNLEQADYLIKGQFLRERFMVSENVESTEYWHVSANLISADNYNKISTVEAWISGEIDSIESLLDQEKPITVIRRPLQINREALEVQGKINEARAFYEKNNYLSSLKIYQELAEKEKTPSIAIYIGLYLNYFMLDREQEAAKSFARLVETSINKNNSLSCKFLFSVNTSNFINDKKLRRQYSMWIKEIGKFFSKNKSCVEIFGHCSKSGSAQYNKNLSLQRAQKMQKLLHKYYHEAIKNTTAVGKGYSDNIIGTGTDNEQDAVDRRVEFKIIECN